MNPRYPGLLDLADHDKLRPTEGIKSDVGGLRLQRFTLRVAGGPDAGAVYASASDRTTIGTDASADFALCDSTMSRFHCEIVIESGRAFIRDLQSRNGTRVNGVKVQSAWLQRGAVISIGRDTLHFELGSVPVQVELADRDTFGKVVGRSRVMRAVFSKLERAATSDITVLLRGETGTGKDLIAESLHQESNRSSGPFSVVDCGAMPPNLLESELFGHERGAFTGAHSSRVGAIEAADGGTLFIDEIGELDATLQPKLLRLLEHREVTRVGGNRPLPVNIRVVAATNRDLRKAVADGKFRSDLYYRLAVMELAVPPLRDRKEDLGCLVSAILNSLGASDSPAAAAMQEPAFIERLASHDWPGNVRELRNYIERGLVLDSDRHVFDPVAPIGSPVVNAAHPYKTARARWLSHFERKYLEDLLRIHNDNVSAAARAAGVDRVYLHRLLRRSGLR